METLAYLVMGILAAFAVIIIAAVTLTILTRIGKVPRVLGWCATGFIGVLTVWTWVAMGERVGLFLGLPFIACLALMLVPKAAK